MMPTKKELLAVLPPYLNKEQVIKQDQGIKDIIKEVLKAHDFCEVTYDQIYPFFDTGDLYATCQKLWDFCKYKLTYKIEPETAQTVRTPTAILQRDNVDCKHYSLFIAGVLDAIKFNEGDNFDWCYRFASYNQSKKIEHVFVVVKVKGKEIWIDPVLDYFNLKQQPTYFKDECPMALIMVSGIGRVGEHIEVDALQAEMDFNKWINLNLFGIADLLRNNPDILNNEVKAYYDANGLDFNHMVMILNNPLRY